MYVNLSMQFISKNVLVYAITNAAIWLDTILANYLTIESLKFDDLSAQIV